MASLRLLLSVSVWLLAGSLIEATYYRHHRYIPMYYRYRENSANTENHLPDVSNPEPQAPTYPRVPEVFHPAPEVIHPIPEAFHPVPEVVHPAAPEPYRPPVAPQAAASPVSMSRVFYAIMFDAGSTGTRIHIYKFIQKDPGKSSLSFCLWGFAAGSHSVCSLLAHSLYAVMGTTLQLQAAGNTSKSR